MDIKLFPPRIVSGFFADLPCMDALFITFVGIAWGLDIFIFPSSTSYLLLQPGAFCPLLMTFCCDFWSYAVVCVMFGVSLSSLWALSSTMLVGNLCASVYFLLC